MDEGMVSLFVFSPAFLINENVKGKIENSLGDSIPVIIVSCVHVFHLHSLVLKMYS